MSRAEPVPVMRRVAGYFRCDEDAARVYHGERHLTPAQRRRGWHKAQRNRVRHAKPHGKLFPTPRRADARAARLEARRG